jgi:integrase
MTLGANLTDAESVKETIAKATCLKLQAGKPWSDARRHIAVAAYTLFLKMHGQKWDPPLCHVTRKLPFIPTEQELDALIAGCGRKTAAFLQLLKETAMRAGEAIRLCWTDIDFERRIITLNTPEKHGNPRMFKVSSKLTDMLATLPKINEKVFAGTTMSSLKTSFYNSRKLLARKLQNPRLSRITFHTFRHWKATMLYHQTRDPLYVKEFLGHKKLDTTLLYIQVEKILYKDDSDEFTVKVASHPEETKQLLEVGFQYICEKEGLLYFRKRK